MTKERVNAPALTQPERPIQSCTEDKLDRKAFTSRLLKALVDESCGISTGVVVGVTGPWGSGKSSILNILHENIQEAYSDAVVVRFDPWLVSGRDNLIAEFIAEIIGSINSNPSAGEKLKLLSKTLAKYGAHVAPVIPGWGSVLKSGLQVLEENLSREKSVYELRRALWETLQSASVPIVVLMDEIDRIEDDEIRTVAQLVRSVVDFPNISYVLAYDASRVIQALGNGVTEEDRDERGRAYLEKIVQLSFSLPITLDEEIKRLLNAELAALDAQLPENWREIGRFQTLEDILIPGLISTPRDIKRFVGTFHVLEGMVRGEVDWIDLLGFSALSIKAPKTVEQIRLDPEEVVQDAISRRGISARYQRDDTTQTDRLRKINPSSEGGDAVRQLLGFLFPSLRRDSGEYERIPDRLCFRRPLLTLLKLGLIPGHYSRASVKEFLSTSISEMQRFLHQAFENDTIGEFLDRVDQVYLDVTDINYDHFWIAASGFLEKPNCDWQSAYSPMYEIGRAVGNMFLSLTGRDGKFKAIAKNTFFTLLESGDVMLVSLLIRHHFFAYGLFDVERRDHYESFLDAEEAAQVAEVVSKDYRVRHLQGDFISCLWGIQPVFAMIDTGIWNEGCRRRLDALLDDPIALDGFTLMLFGAHYSTERISIDKMTDYSRYLDRVKERLSDPALKNAHETVRVALQKASEGTW